ncbi:MAG: DMT family transporter [Bacteroidetes bacterium]|nr:DMT family transporter [Bacteroidota bacterium]
MTKNTLAHITLTIVSIVYGANYVIIKFVSPEPMGPSGLVLIRTIMAVAFFWVAGIFVKKQKEIEKADWPKIVLCAFCGSAFNQLCFFQGAVNTSPIDASLIMTSNPIIVLLFASVLLKEKINSTKMLGIALGCIGAVFIIMQKEGGNTSSSLYGNTMIFVNSILFGLYIVLVKPLITKYDTITLMKWIFLFGLLMLIPFGYNEVMTVNWAKFDDKIWWSFFYSSAIVTFFAYVPNILALRWVSSASVSSYLYVQPVIAVVLAMLWLNEALSFSAIFAAILIFIGVYLVGKESKS